jgi:hypothetical protein
MDFILAITMGVDFQMLGILEILIHRRGLRKRP